MKEFIHPFLDKYLHYEYISSTMEKAEELIESDNFKGNFLIAADKQGNGIGRKGNNWYSPAGGLWITLGIYGFSFKPNFTLLCGLQLLKALSVIQSDLENRLYIKWPNDLYYQDKKLAGIIVKNYPKYNYYLIGIGLNTNTGSFPDHLKDIAVSLKAAEGKEYNNSAVMTEFLDVLNSALPEYLSTYKLDEDYYQKHDLLSGQEVAIITEFAEYRGSYYGISPDGAILLKLVNGAIQPFYAGEIKILS